MKKNKFNLVIALLLVCVSIFAGCTKADSAKMDTITKLFNTEVGSLLTGSENYGANIIKTEPSGTQISYVRYSFELSYNGNGALDQQINSTETNKYSILKEDKAYATLLNHASKYFFDRIMNTNWQTANADNFDKISQQALTNLYNQVEATIDKIDEFGKSVKVLSSGFTQESANSIIPLNNLEKLLEKYQQLISQVLSLNFAAQDVADNYFGIFDMTAEEVSSVEITRLVNCYELYITEYLFQRYMVFGGELFVDFSSNALLEKLDALVAKLKNSSSLEGIKSDDNAFVYLKNMEKTLKNSVDINRGIVEDLDAKIPQETDENYAINKLKYEQFINYEQQLNTCIDLLNNLLS